ncbi:hypothetical protein LguiB_016612 [Lonicera macranthoides]
MKRSSTVLFDIHHLLSTKASTSDAMRKSYTGLERTNLWAKGLRTGWWGSGSGSIDGDWSLGRACERLLKRLTIRSFGWVGCLPKLDGVPVLEKQGVMFPHFRSRSSFGFLRYFFISVPEIDKIRLKKLLHHDAIELVHTLCKRITESNDPQSVKDSALKEALFVAGRLGIGEVVKEIVLEYPDAIWLKDENNYNIIQLAIIQRQEHVFKLIYRRSGQQRYLTSVKDVSSNNILHLAGKLAPRHKLELIAGPVLQMQRELQWFKEVENLVNSTQKNELNCYKQTPSMVFSAEHKELVMEGENWLKGMANSATSILISAIIFAATFSIPGGYNGDDCTISSMVPVGQLDSQGHETNIKSLNGQCSHKKGKTMHYVVTLQ